MNRITEIVAVSALLLGGFLWISGCDASANTVVEPLAGPDPSMVDETSYEEEMRRQTES